MISSRTRRRSRSRTQTATRTSFRCPSASCRGSKVRSASDSLQALLIANGSIPEGFTLASGSPPDRAETFTADNFELARGKDNPLRDLTFNGNLNFDLGAVNLRLGGGLATQRANPYSFSNSLYNRNTFYNDETDSYRLYGTFLQRLSNSSFYQLQGEFQDYQFVRYPEGFSDSFDDILRYGDANDPSNAVAQRYYVFRDEPGDGTTDPVYVPQYNRDSGARPSQVVGVAFSLPGPDDQHQLPEVSQPALPLLGQRHDSGRRPPDRVRR